ncbi:MAG: aminotransferase class V-fold PLP-dependent enzyme [Patescibacteria group bacterium]|jgi:cysteine desulfurase/selenocysteine lyase
MLNYEKIKNDFPLLNKQAKEKPIVYFDSACMSLKPKQVIEVMNEYYFDFPACSGRSSHRLGELVTKKMKEARRIVANFISADEQEIVFTRNTTEAINLLANTLDLKNGDLVLTTDKEHNSNLIPWQVLTKKKGIRHEIVKLNDDGTFNLEKYKELVKGARLVSMVHTSNLDGTTIPAKEIIKIAHENGALVFLDAAQSAPHKKINVKDLDVDFLAFSGHKMLGPTGTGVFYGKYNLLERLEPFMVGGDTVEYSTYTDHKMLKAPEKFEAGLQDYAGIIGLSEAVNYLETIGFDNIKEQELMLNRYITEEINKLPKIKIIGPSDPALRSGIISFYIDGTDMHQVALMLDEMSGIMIRSGQHCVHSWFNDKKIKNSARVSLYFYNTMEEAEKFISSLNKIIKIL